MKKIIAMLVLGLFIISARAADKVAEQIVSDGQKQIEKIKQSMVDKLKMRMEALKKSGDDKTAEEIKGMITELEGDKDASAAGDENTEKQDNTQPDGWISKDATYEISSNHKTPQPQFLTCEGNEAFAFATVGEKMAGGKQWCKIDLKQVYEIIKIEVENRTDGLQGQILGAELLLSLDGKKWTKVGTFKKAEPKYVFTVKGNKKAQYVKIQMTSEEGMALKTMKVFGK